MLSIKSGTIFPSALEILFSNYLLWKDLLDLSLSLLAYLKNYIQYYCLEATVSRVLF